MLTTTDYIGIGVLITSITSGMVQIIGALKIKSIDSKADDIIQKVNGAATAQNVRIENLVNHVSDLKSVIAANSQIAAVLASRVDMEKKHRNE